MNLIKKYGSYEKAKAKLDTLDKRLYGARALKVALLQYRREHGIFEVKDKVRFQDGAALNHSIWQVTENDRGKDSSIFLSNIVVAPICGINGRLIVEGSFSVCPPYKLQHATDAEIEAKRCLSGEPKWGRAVELDRLNQGITITSTPSGEAPFYQAFREAVNTGRSAIVVTWDEGRDITNE